MYRMETELVERPKGRAPTWVMRIFDGDRVVFTSDQLSVRFRDEKSALMLGDATLIALEAGFSLINRKTSWDGDLSDDCSARIGSFTAHAEHLDGPKRGGNWYFQVHDVLHSETSGIQPRSGDSARQICEIVAAAADSGFAGDA